MFDLGVAATRSKALHRSSPPRATPRAKCASSRARPGRGASQLIAPREQEHEYYVDHRGDLFYIRTNAGGRNFRLVTAPVASAATRRTGRSSIAAPRRRDARGLDLFRDYLVAARARGRPAADRDHRSRADGASHAARRFPRPIYPSVSAHNPEFDTTALPLPLPVVRRRRLASTTTTWRRSERKLLKQQQVLGGYDPRSTRRSASARPRRDGAKVPVSLVYQKGLGATARQPLCSTATARTASPIAAHFDVDRVSACSTAASSTPSRTSAAAATSARSGTTRAG